MGGIATIRGLERETSEGVTHELQTTTARPAAPLGELRSPGAGRRRNAAAESGHRRRSSDIDQSRRLHRPLRRLSPGRAARLASIESLDSAPYTLCRDAAIAPGERARRRSTAAHVLQGCRTRGALSPERWRLPRVREGRRWRRVVPALPI